MRSEQVLGWIKQRTVALHTLADRGHPGRGSELGGTDGDFGGLPANP